MTLYDICLDIAHVENGLADGEMTFSYDNLMSAMKPGHPADILDDIFCDIGNELFLDNNKKIALKRVEKMLSELVVFKKCFKVKEMAKPIRELRAYIKEKSTEGSTNA